MLNAVNMNHFILADVIFGHEINNAHIQKYINDTLSMKSPQNTNKSYTCL